MNKVIIESTAEVPKDAPLAVNPLVSDSSSAVMIDTVPSVEDTLKPKVSLTSNTTLHSKATEFCDSDGERGGRSGVLERGFERKLETLFLHSGFQTCQRESEMISEQSARHPC